MRCHTYYFILLVAKLTQHSVYCQRCNSDDNSSSGASHVLCLVIMHFMILPHANCNMNLSEAKLGHLGTDKHSWKTLAYLSSRNVVTSAWLFTSFSPFMMNQYWSYSGSLCRQPVSEMNSKMNLCVSLQFLRFNQKTWKLLRFWVRWQHTDNVWYRRSCAVGSETLIGLSANMLKCKYYAHFWPDIKFYIIFSPLLFFQENKDFQSAPF